MLGDILKGESNVMKATVSKELENKQEISLQNIQILCVSNLVYANENIVILNFEGFNVTIEKPAKNMQNYACVVTLIYNQVGKLEKDVFYLKTISQLIKWLRCIRAYSQKMFVFGCCDKVENISQALDKAPFYLLARLNDAIKE